MEIKIEWQKPIQLTVNKRLIVDAEALPVEVAALPGVYFFARWFGATSVPFYIGQSLDIRIRLKQHLNTTKIYKALVGISGGDVDLGVGPRYFHFGYFKAKQGQQAKSCTRDRRTTHDKGSCRKRPSDTELSGHHY